MKVSFEIAKETYKIGIFKTIPVHVLYWTTEFNESELSAIERMNIGEELVVGMPTIAYPQKIEENRQRYPKLNGFAPFLLEDLVKCSDGGKRLWRYETELDARQGVADFKRFLVNLKSALSARLRRWQKVSSCEAAALSMPRNRLRGTPHAPARMKDSTSGPWRSWSAMRTLLPLPRSASITETDP